MSAVVKLRGLPWSATAQEIVSFFTPVPMGEESVTLISQSGGRASGEAFVWIHEANMAQALTYNKGSMGNRYIEVFESTFEEYTAAVRRMSGGGGDTQAPKSRQVVSAPGAGAGARPAIKQAAEVDYGTVTESVLRVRGLPYSVTGEDLAEMFGVPASEVNICMTTGGAKVGVPSGEAFVRFDSVDTAHKAFTNMQGETIGSRYVELFASSEGELETRVAHGGVQGYESNRGTGGDLNPQESREGSGWIRLRGLPYSATVQEVVDFVSLEHFVAEYDVTIKIGSDGRPTGEAYVQLESEEVANELKPLLDRKHLGSRFIEVFVSSYEECSAVRHNRNGPYSNNQRDDGYGKEPRGGDWGKGGGYGRDSGKGGKGYGKGSSPYSGHGKGYGKGRKY